MFSQVSVINNTSRLFEQVNVKYKMICYRFRIDQWRFCRGHIVSGPWSLTYSLEMMGVYSSSPEVWWAELWSQGLHFHALQQVPAICTVTPAKARPHDGEQPVHVSWYRQRWTTTDLMSSEISVSVLPQIHSTSRDIYASFSEAVKSECSVDDWILLVKQRKVMMCLMLKFIIRHFVAEQISKRACRSFTSKEQTFPAKSTIQTDTNMS